MVTAITAITRQVATVMTFLLKFKLAPWLPNDKGSLGWDAKINVFPNETNLCGFNLGHVSDYVTLSTRASGPLGLNNLQCEVP